MNCSECGNAMRLALVEDDSPMEGVDASWKWVCDRGHATSSQGIETCSVCGRQCLNRRYDAGKSAIPVQMAVGCTQCVNCNICGSPLGSLPRTFNSSPRNPADNSGSDWSHIGCIARQQETRRREAQPYQPSLSEVTQSRFVEEPRAATILTLGILSLLCCGIVFGPMAWVMASTDLHKIDSGIASDKDRSLIVVGQTLGIIGTAFAVLGLLWALIRHSSQ
jgi:hypothetical protein